MHVTIALLIGIIVGFVGCWFLRDRSIRLLQRERDQLKAAAIRTVNKF